MTLHWDWETRGVVDLTKRGPYVYAQHPQTDALLASFKLTIKSERDYTKPVRVWIENAGPVNQICRWKRGEPCPPYVRAYVEAGGEVTAFNAAFERLIWWHIMTPRHGWPKPAMEQFRCTAVTAAAMSLPRSLDRLGAALDLQIKKDKAGKDLMKIHSIPVGFNPDGSAIWHPLVDDPASLEKYHRYCDFDVLTEEEADLRLIPLSDAEMKVYWLNETINDRGLRIDVQSAKAALRIAAEAKRLINEELTALTEKKVTAFTQAAKLKEWIAAQGVTMPSMDKDDVDDFLHNYDDLPARVRRALELRQEGAKPSVDKISAMLNRCCDDGRARGVYLHHGAGQTGRFSSRGVQAHNMPKYRKVFENAKLRQDELFEAIRTGEPAALTTLYGPELGRPLHILSDAVRGFIWAAPGCTFFDADYSSIEGRMGAWFAGEDWKLDAFKALDRGEGFGIYEMMAAGIYNVLVEEVTKAQRPTGKVAELSCFGESTLVLTERGPVPIVEVKLSDRLWDGVEWVNHAGVVARNARPVAAVDGILVTPDHLILTGRTWKPVSKLAGSRSFLDLALATGSARLPWSGSRRVSSTVLKQSSFNATVARLRTMFTLAISGAADPGAALRARRLRVPAREKNIGVMLTSVLTMRTADGYSIESRLASSVAQTLGTPGTETTVDEAYESSGLKIVELFSRISSLLTGGINQSWNWIVRRLTATMRPETSDSSHVSRTCSTSAAFQKCSSEYPTLKPVYDITNAGPRSRFTICSATGFLIAHNCMYQTGVGGIRKFARQNKVKLASIYPALWASADQEKRGWVEGRFKQRVAAHDPNTDALGREGWIAAELIKIGWRNKHPKIVAAWKALEDAAIKAVESPGVKVDVIGVTYMVAHGFLWCRLPSGRCLAYGAPKMKEVEAPWADKTLEPEKREKKLSLTARGTDAQTEKWTRFSLYGGSLFNNVVQGSAADILRHGMFKAEEAGFPVFLHTHDEIASERPIGNHQIEDLEQILCDLPDWAKTLPLTASGYVSKRYKKD